MIVPSYWAEGRAEARQGKRPITVRRFGWSDASEDEARRNADLRAAEALRRLLAGEKLPRRERKRPYNGADGVPIREEIVARFGPTILTRNAYGARCLNTPDVLFADIDFPDAPPLAVTAPISIGAALSVMGFGWYHGHPKAGLVFAFFVLIVVPSLLRGFQRLCMGGAAGEERRARRRIRRFLEAHPDWNLRLYRTPAGFRALVTHRPFDPAEPAVAEFFGALRTDPIYRRMCANQRCFRARVSAKPWRIGIPEHLRPRPGIWPVAPERLPLRHAWVEKYEAVAKDFAACRFLESLGSGTSHASVGAVVALHDDLCGATSERPLA